MTIIYQIIDENLELKAIQKSDPDKRLHKITQLIFEVIYSKI